MCELEKWSWNYGDETCGNRENRENRMVIGTQQSRKWQPILDYISRLCLFTTCLFKLAAHCFLHSMSSEKKLQYFKSYKGNDSIMGSYSTELLDGTILIVQAVFDGVEYIFWKNGEEKVIKVSLESSLNSQKVTTRYLSSMYWNHRVPYRSKGIWRKERLADV